ncbi:unnamed protein product, partial [Pocillopora meandrina]
MVAISLNYWLPKFVMEVAKESGERYPPRTVYGIVCGLKRHLGDKYGDEKLNPLDAHDKRFGIFRRALDAEMKDATKEGLHIKCQKEEKEFLGSNFIKFQENSCKTFHGGVSDLKYIPRTVKHICHEEGVKH